MYVDIPKVSRCCFCFPLRKGIIVFSYFNLIMMSVSIAYLVITTELKKMEGSSATILLSLIWMIIILNVLLLIGSYQKDSHLLILHNYYATATLLFGFVPAVMMLFRVQLVELCGILIAMSVQLYLIILVRSKVMNLEASRSYSETTSCDMTEHMMSNNATEDTTV